MFHLSSGWNGCRFLLCSAFVSYFDQVLRQMNENVGMQIQWLRFAYVAMLHVWSKVLLQRLIVATSMYLSREGRAEKKKETEGISLDVKCVLLCYAFFPVWKKKKNKEVVVITALPLLKTFFFPFSFRNTEQFSVFFKQIKSSQKEPKKHFILKLLI